ncbi:hypothetical protein B0H15DRAFT_802728 [Mycena belliarum]|uniref:Fungal-type protein kinase domain-containing protein n=1 Tax=Mycena belliarum TaxID=1033014 RepID=A0AAD6U0E8_9AGAR|nr:hypothetical protein B0H15DRAFT_802728 [Mycena belliae]
MVIVYTGLPLRNARGPRDLLEALVHAMIGYINLLDQDYQHHDISNGNILLVEPFEVASSSDEILGTRHFFGIRKCRGILVDGADGKEQQANRRSLQNTLPFMSQDMLDEMDWPSNTTHTALDDLESFIWVLVWECLHKGKSRNSLSNWDLKSLDGFKDCCPQHLASFKGAFLSTCRNVDPELEDSFLSPLAVLLAQWAGIRSEARRQMIALEKIRRRLSTDDSDGAAQVLDKMDVLCRNTGLKYVHAGLGHLANLGEAWALS